MIQCPSLEHLSRFLTERCGEGERVELADHVETCTGCQQTLEGLTRNRDAQEWGQPVVGYGRPRLDGAEDFVIAQASDAGWLPLYTRDAGEGNFSNLACDRAGTVMFAYTENGGQRILLARGQGTTWTSELVWEDTKPEDDPLTPVVSEIQLVTIIDARDRPVIAAVRQLGNRAWLQVFRPSG
jgi:hypothetical protein